MLAHYFNSIGIKKDIKHISCRINISVNSLICLPLLLFNLAVCYNEGGWILIKKKKDKKPWTQSEVSREVDVF